MQVEVISGHEIDDALVAEWRSRQASCAAWESPLFCPEFIRAVASEREGVEVALIRDGSQLLGILSFHRSRRNVMEPVAGSFTDFESIVGLKDRVDVREVVRQAGCSAWRFNSLVAAPTVKPHSKVRGTSRYMDLSGGFEAYRVERRRAGTDELQEALRKSRKISRDVAPLRFEATSTDESGLRTLIEWKREQLEHRKLPDCFAAPWVLPMLERIAATRGEGFAGMLSTLHVGDDLLAVSLGSRHRGVLHGWITAYNRDYRRYSPGLILLVKLAQEAESSGIHRIDMGRGNESFKNSFATGGVPVAEGVVDSRSLAGSAARSWLRAKQLARSTPLYEPARRAMHRVQRTRLQLKAFARLS